MKNCTDIGQSRKLMKILSIKSADMVWILFNPDLPTIKAIAYKDSEKCKYYETLPAWSLDALLETMPQSITKYIESERCQKTFHLNLFRSYYHCCSYSFVSSVSDDDGNNTLYCTGRDNWIDACYEMILKLNELNEL